MRCVVFFFLVASVVFGCCCFQKTKCVLPFLTGHEIAHQLQDCGVCRVATTLYGERDFERLYQDFDAFIEQMQHSECEYATLRQAEHELVHDTAYSFQYCGAPPSYRDPRVYPSKRFSKIYFQFSRPLYEYIHRCGYDTLSVQTHRFLADLWHLDMCARHTFADVLSRLEDVLPGIQDLFYAGYDELTVVSKVIRYEQSDSWGTTPHRDKSGLTLIWHSDDEPENERLVVSSDPNAPAFEKLIPVVRQRESAYGGAVPLLISGIASPLVGLPLPATFHGVMPIHKPYRYAVISFLLIPHIDMTDVVSDFMTDNRAQ